MKKLLIKMFMPSAETVAEWMTEGIAKAVNDSGKTATLAKYGDIAARTTDIQKTVVEWIKDGYIADEEKKQIIAALTPLVQKVLDLL